MITVPLLNREHCNCWLKDIRFGQSITECKKCDKVIHTKCFKSSKFSIINDLNYCDECEDDIVVRYNPFLKLIELSRDEKDDNCEFDYDYSEMSRASDVLERCDAFSVETFNKLESSILMTTCQHTFLTLMATPVILIIF